MKTNSVCLFGKNIHFVDATNADRTYPICKGVEYVIPGYINTIELLLRTT